MNSDPTKDDSDEDGIEDKPETDDDGVKLDVVSKSVTVDGKTYTGPYRWDPDKNNDEVTIETHPLNPDSDGDGLGDGKEQNEYHTRADRKVSYSITEIHQDRIVEPSLKYDVERLENLGLLTSRDVQDLKSDGLTDATDDFDLVTTDDRSLVFTALDRTERTDTWLSNREEIAIGTDPWDPDTDDDGLTDGQEAKWLTTAEKIGSGPGPGTYDVNRGDVIGTNASKNDTDGDGYWDGWIGVHGVGNTSNVVLDMEHLRTLGGAPDLGPVWQG